MSLHRAYEKTHPWIKFSVAELQRPNSELWMMLGECQSKCEHIAGVALDPAIAKVLQSIFLVKGVQGTAAIEGNTLTEEEIARQMEGNLVLPPSREYLAQEVQNVIDGLQIVCDAAIEGTPLAIDVQSVSRLNGVLLRNLALDKDVVPGEIRKNTVGVFRYRGAPSEDCAYLVDRLGKWLRSDDFTGPPAHAVVMAIIKSVIAHLYLAWIHPFGDGNGRTARLVEFSILFGAGVPAPAAHLLSNHYNLTRNEYYRQLDHASSSGGEISAFLKYAVQGLLDGLREQLRIIRKAQYDVIWRNYVYESFGDTANRPNLRRRELVLALSKVDTPVRLSLLSSLNTKVARYYMDTSYATLNRDIADLLRRKLILQSDQGLQANKKIVEAFLPSRAVLNQSAVS